MVDGIEDPAKANRRFERATAAVEKADVEWRKRRASGDDEATVAAAEALDKAMDEAGRARIQAVVADAHDRMWEPLREACHALEEAERAVVQARFERDQLLENMMPRVGVAPGPGQATPYRIAQVMKHWARDRHIGRASTLSEAYLGRIRKAGAFKGEGVDPV